LGKTQIRFEKYDVIALFHDHGSFYSGTRRSAGETGRGGMNKNARGQQQYTANKSKGGKKFKEWRDENGI